MTREALEHIIRAAASIASDDDIVILGSQSVLGQHPDAPAAMLASVEADVYPRNRPERWDVIDASIGEESYFHRTFGYYAQGVEEHTAVLPAGWKTRLVPIRTPSTGGATGWALDLHDLIIAKYVAGREKDHVYIAAAVDAGLVQQDVLLSRLASTELDPERRVAVAARLRADFSRATRSGG